MNPDYEFRPSTEADNDAIAMVWHSSASLPGVGPAVMPTVADLRQRIDVELAADWSVIVAVRDDEIIGFLAIKPKEAVLAEIFVRPDCLGAGIGQALLACAKNAMPDGFTLHTRVSNVKAQRFYERAGLHALREDIHPRSGDPIIYYGWEVGRATDAQ